MKRKIFSIILSIAMIAVMMPNIAFADEIQTGKLVKAGEYTLNVVNDSEAPGIYAVTINDKAFKVALPGRDKTNIKIEVPEGLNGNISGSTLTVQLDKGDTYSVQLLSRPDYYTVTKSSATYGTGTDEVGFSGDEFSAKAGEDKDDSMDKYVIFKRHLTNKTSYTETTDLPIEDTKTIRNTYVEGEEFLPTDSGDYILYDGNIQDLKDCKTYSGGSLMPESWKSFPEGKYFFVPFKSDGSANLYRWQLSAPAKQNDTQDVRMKYTIYNFLEESGVYKFKSTANTVMRPVWESEGNILKTWPSNATQKRQYMTNTIREFINENRPNDFYTAETKIVYTSSGGLKSSNKELWIYQLIEKVTFKKEYKADENITLTFSAEATKNVNDATLKLLNEERVIQLNEVLGDSELIASILKDKDNITNIDSEKLETIAPLLEKEYLGNAGALLKTDNMPLGSEISMEEVDLKDGFYEGLKYEFKLKGPEFLTVNPDYLIQQTTIGNQNKEIDTIPEIVNYIKGFPLFSSMLNEDAYRVLYILEKNLTKPIQAPISLGGRYVADSVRAGVYKVSVTDPANGWTLDDHELYVKVDANGNITQVNENGEALDESDTKLLTDKNVAALDVETLIINASDSDSLTNLAGALAGWFEDGKMYAAQETGLWVSHEAPTVTFSSMLNPGAEYVLINEDQLRDLVNALLAFGKDAINDVKDGIGYTELKDIGNIVNGISSGEITTDQIKDILITALEKSDDLEGINIPTVLKATADEKGVVAFDESTDYSIGELTDLVTTGYAEVNKAKDVLSNVTAKIKQVVDKVKGTVDRIKNSVNSVVDKIKNIFKRPSKNADTNLLTMQAPPTFYADGPDYVGIVGKMGDEQLVKGIQDFMGWLGTIKSPELKIDMSSVTLYSNEARTQTFTITERDFHPENYSFKWNNGQPENISYEVKRTENDKVQVKVSSSVGAVNNDGYPFTVSGTFDGLTLSVSGTVKVQQHTTTQTHPEKVTLSEQQGSVITGQEGQVYFNISTENLTDPTFTWEWTKKDVTGLTPKIEDGKLVVDVTKDAAPGEYEIKVTAKGTSETYQPTATKKVVVEQLPKIDQIIKMVDQLGNNNLGYTALNLVGLKDGTLPEGNYILIQTSVPKGQKQVYGYYKVKISWQDGKYKVDVVASPLANLSQLYNSFTFYLRQSTPLN
ncbi:MAG: hypothetical protein MJ146_02220 [Clostridia bacterium]|nr:hypothetical protein [Clostridia bacterium]